MPGLALALRVSVEAGLVSTAEPRVWRRGEDGVVHPRLALIIHYLQLSTVNCQLLNVNYLTYVNGQCQLYNW